MVNLTDEQKQKISEMSSPKEMETNERKRQYSALRRAIRSSGNPALTTKFETCNDTDRWGAAAHRPSNLCYIILNHASIKLLFVTTLIGSMAHGWFSFVPSNVFHYGLKEP